MDRRTLIFTLFLSYVYYFRDVETVVQDGEKQVSNMKKLKNLIFKDYDKAIRPVKHHSNETIVFIDVAPLYLIDLDEEKSLFSLDSWFILHWVDERLSWNPVDYDGLEHLPVTDDYIWQPDVTIYNAHSGNVDPKKNTHAVIYSNGEIWWVPPTVVTSYCAVRMTSAFPRDTHLCNVEIGSWAHDGWQINLTLYSDTMYMDHYLDTNPKWQLLKTNLSREVQKYSCCEEPYITIHASFLLKRRYPAYLEVIWVPCLLIMILTLTMFWVSSDSGKKLSLGGSLLLMLTVLLVYVAAVSKGSLTPTYAVAFVRSVLIAVSSAVFLEVIVLNLSRLTGPQRPPEALVVLLSGPVGKYIGVWATWCDSIPVDRIQLKEDVEQTDHKHTIRDEWLLVASAIDRFLFVVYVVVFAAIHGV